MSYNFGVFSSSRAPFGFGHQIGRRKINLIYIYFGYEKIYPPICSLPFLLWYPSIAQNRLTEHTLTEDKSAPQTKYKITDLNWLTGRWVGEGFGGQLEENWNPPIGNAMLGTFRVTEEGQAKFYELCLIVEEGNTLVYKVKHFNPDFSGWEEKDEFASFRLLKVEPNAAYFDGLTIRRIGNTVTQYLAMKTKDGSHREEALSFKLDGASEQVD